MKNNKSTQTVVFKIKKGVATCPRAWRVRNSLPGEWGWNDTGSMWVARLDYNAEGADEVIPAAVDGIGSPVVRWGPFASVTQGRFDAGGIQEGRALAFGIQGDGPRWRQYGAVVELKMAGGKSADEMLFQITNSTVEAVKLSEEIRARINGPRQLVRFNGDAPLIKQLETLSSIWGGPEVLAIALDWILEQGRGGQLLPMPPPLIETSVGRLSSGPNLQQLPRESDERHMHYRSWEQPTPIPIVTVTEADRRFADELKAAMDGTGPKITIDSIDGWKAK